MLRTSSFILGRVQVSPLRFSVCHDAPVPKYSPRDFYSCHAVLVLVQTWKPWQDCANSLTRVGPTLRLWRSNHADNLDSIQLLAVLQAVRKCDLRNRNIYFGALSKSSKTAKSFFLTGHLQVITRALPRIPRMETGLGFNL